MSTSTPLSISIIIPIYNVEPYIEKCLDSVDKQNYQNYEVILVNDGSTDLTINLVEQFIKNKTDKFKLFHKKNGGLADARNYGLVKASNEFILFLDSDDYISPETLSITSKSAQVSQSDIICFALAEVTESENKIRYIPANAKLPLGTYQLNDADNLISSSLPNACNKLIRKSLFTNNHIKFPPGLWYEDLATNPKLFYFASQITFIGDELYYYRQREGAITKTFSLKVMDIYDVLTDIGEFFVLHPYPNAKTDLNTWYINLTIITLARLSLNNEYKLKANALTSISENIKKRFPNPIDIYQKAFSKKRYKVFTLLIRLGMIKMVAFIIKKLVAAKAITI